MKTILFTYGKATITLTIFFEHIFLIDFHEFSFFSTLKNQILERSKIHHVYVGYISSKMLQAYKSVTNFTRNT